MHLPQTLYQQSVGAYLSGAISEAEALIQKSLALQPDHFPSLLLLGQILERSNKIKYAVAAYDRAAKVSPGHALPFTRRSVLTFRATFGEPPHPRVGAPNSPAVSMRSLGANGRFGNQLLQYAFTRLYAQEHGLRAEVSDWIGRDLFDLDDPIPAVNFQTQIDLMDALNGATKVFANCDLVGYFLGPTHLWRQRQEQFRAFFEPGKKVAPLLDRAMAAIRLRGKTLIVVHLRRTDYGYGRFWIAPARWYIEWLDRIWGKLDQPVLYVASDDTRAAAEFSKFAPLTMQALGVDIPGANFYFDHYLLSNADYVAISNSTFSFSAAMLNRRAKEFMRPHPERRCLVSFDPWNSDLLMDAKDLGQIPNEERAAIRHVVRSNGLAVYVGEFCSAWAAVTRSIHPNLQIVETSAETTLDQLRADRGIAHITDLVIEKPENVFAVLAGCRGALRYARIDAIHFRCGAASREIIRMLGEEGFKVFRISRQSTLEPVDTYVSDDESAYIAVQNRLLPIFTRQKIRMLDIAALCSQHGIQVRGVLHVGAHEGQEITTYDAVKAQQVVFVEANPAVYGRLLAAMAGRSDVICVQRAICNRTGPVHFHLASFDQSASLFPMARHRQVYPQIVPMETIEVEGTTLDALLRELQLPFTAFNFLHVDVQGAEALVLKGATDVLPYIDAISIEVNFSDLYENGAQIEDIEDLLHASGFRRAELLSSFDPSWGDAFYVRREGARLRTEDMGNPYGSSETKPF
jgi:FkbM family methyltransferase